MYLPERKQSQASGSFGKGFHALIAHMLKAHNLNRLMTERCLRKSLQLRPKFHSLFLQNNFDFLHLKDLNCHLDCTEVSFNLEKWHLLLNRKVTDRETDRQTK